MIDRGSLIARALLTLVFSYLLAVGATFNGVLNPEFHPLTYGLIVTLLIIWLWVRWRRGWRWHRPPLDWIILLWCLSILLSLLANLDVWRRIAIGLWYVSLYIAVWLTLSDLLANRAFSTRTVVDALLISGIVVVCFGFIQVLPWWVRVLEVGLQSVLPPRPVSLFGNPNYLGSYLTVLIPFIVVRLISARTRLPRLMLLLYCLSAFLLLLLTFSRGAWVGVLLGLALMLALFLADRGLLSRLGMTAFWNCQPSRIRLAMATSSCVVMITLVGFGLTVLNSFSLSGRSADLRGELYRAAVLLLAEKPVAGQGLFTYGRELLRLPDIRPDRPHSHAHNLPLQIGAELGAVGLLVLLVTLIAVLRRLRAGWRLQSSVERIEYAGALGAITAFGVHHLTDLPAMMPAIALIGLLPLIVALSVRPSSVLSRMYSRVFTVVVLLLWSILLVLGLWSSRVYTDYVSILRDAAASGAYRQAADALTSVIDSDPALSLYRAQQAFLYGLAAAEGDVTAVDPAIAAYTRFLELEPGYGFAWANLSALYQTRHNLPAALDSLAKAATLDGGAWQYRVGLARLLKDSGDTITARSELAAALQIYPDAFLLSEIASFADDLGVTVSPTEMSLHARMLQQLLSGDVQGATDLWAQRVPLDPVPDHVLSAILMAVSGSLDGAQAYLDQGMSFVDQQPVDSAWVSAGHAWIAWKRAGSATMRRDLVEARSLLRRGPFAADNDLLINIPYAQFLRLAIPRFHLPAVYYSVDNPVLLRLLDYLESR